MLGGGIAMTEIIELSPKRLMRGIKKLGKLMWQTWPGNIRVYGVPRGGIPVALALAIDGYEAVDKPEDAQIIVDDIIDSGATRRRFADQHFAALYSKIAEDLPDTVHAWESHPGRWIVFPWEKNEDHSAMDIPLRLLQFIGEDPQREGLRETPARFLKACREWFAGYGIEPKELLKAFEDGADNVNEMVLIKDIPLYSHCEHHLAPFFGVAHVAYIPNGKIIGLSKINRVVDAFARRLQVQERLTNQIADAIEEALKPLGVAVVLNCRHLCMESRGIRHAGATTTTSAVRGALYKPAARAEFFSLIGGRHG